MRISPSYSSNNLSNPTTPASSNPTPSFHGTHVHGNPYDVKKKAFDHLFISCSFTELQSRSELLVTCSGCRDPGFPPAALVCLLSNHIIHKRYRLKDCSSKRTDTFAFHENPKKSCV
ncbi:hypothetical protein TNIN_404371 [Trichonephila inaurata madagascariensis]|uniref:Uncharacterized protein n=1 Tax=Trichonephila inaurata madagascariensis TaxID=2747483 RepID=A0A8X6YX22_9ARAC|nr:hypothetical protein TNIN_404371 [Trichonephila inaurata madagascariensis]